MNKKDTPRKRPVIQRRNVTPYPSRYQRRPVGKWTQAWRGFAQLPLPVRLPVFVLYYLWKTIII